MTDRPDEPPFPTPPPTRRIVVHAAVLDGVSRLFALSAARAREAELLFMANPLHRAVGVKAG